MARTQTRSKVYAAVLALAGAGRIGALSMEGIAGRAGVSKQTLYRTWSSPGDIVFDALLARSQDADGSVLVPDAGELRADLESLVTDTVHELTDPAVEPLLRAVTASIQTDQQLADQYRERLWRPQFEAVAERFQKAGFPVPELAAELLLGAILHRWLLRTGPFTSEWVVGHVDQVMRIGIPAAASNTAAAAKPSADPAATSPAE